jgi:hypothetical protein
MEHPLGVSEIEKWLLINGLNQRLIGLKKITGDLSCFNWKHGMPAIMAIRG